ncbi:MAG: peptide chain release factor N(5)-glutamine methyltransferase [Bryobacteraceae bacterium]|nr:peptide chain release factor N(5)-glutamine methyltransferase [Bryobacteraceae bacterium]
MRPELRLGDAVRQGTKILARGGVDSPRLTAEVLLAHALGVERVYLIAHSEDRLTELAWIHYGRWLHERLSGKPTQYITRKQEFYGREFSVAPGVLIPRPETELAVERAIELARDLRGPIVDVGTGSGSIAVTLACELRRRVYAVDLAPVELARANARRHNADVVFWRGDLLTALRNAALIVTNPPYLPDGDALPREVGEWEPPLALYGGPDGLAVWRRIIEQTPAGAWLVGEIDSRADMLPLFDNAFSGKRWEHVEIRPDLADKPRVLSARRI